MAISEETRAKLGIKLILYFLPLLLGSSGLLYALFNPLSTSQLFASFGTLLFWRALTITFILSLLILGFRLISLSPKKQPDPFVSKYRRLFNRVLLYLIAATMGVAYFFYGNYWQFRLSAFESKDNSILVASFQEADVSAYFPSGGYSQYVKNRLLEAKLPCENFSPIEIKSTEAFFTSREEAIRFARKANAGIVLWGEVLRTDGHIITRPRISMTHSTIIASSEGLLGGFNLLRYFEQKWALDSIAVNIDQLVVELAQITPVISMLYLKENPDKGDLIEYMKCVLSSDLLIHKSVDFLFSYELATQLESAMNYDSATEYWERSYDAFQQNDLNLNNINKRAAKCAYFLMVDRWGKCQDSAASQFAQEACKLDTTLALNFKVSFVGYILVDRTDEAIDVLEWNWNRSADTLSGDILYWIYHVFGKTPTARFPREFDSLYPGRGLKINENPLIYIDTSCG